MTRLSFCFLATLAACVVFVPVDAKEPPAAKEPSTLEGRFVFKGNPPAAAPLVGPQKGPAAALFAAALKKGILNPHVIDPNTKGVANVVVFLKRPTEGKWPIQEMDKVRKEPLVIDAPLLAFEPRISVHYPEWFDGKDRGKTGQEFILMNSSPAAMNYRAIGDGKINDGFNMLALRNEPINVTKVLAANKQLKPQLLPIGLVDNLHSWMQGYVFLLDHPYYAITKEDGTFSIARVPVGMEVQVMAWHETTGWLLNKKYGKSIALKKGKNTVDFEMPVP